MTRSRSSFDLPRAWPLLASIALMAMGWFFSANAAAQTPPMNGQSPLLGCPAIVGTSNNPCNWDSANIMWAIQHPHPDLDTIAAHRGIHALANTTQVPNVPENSLQAIGFAAQEGWEAIEIDVKITSDGVPIMSHDETWGREWCGTTFFQGHYDPLQPNTGGNASVNPQIASTSLADTRSNLGTTYLRDSVSIFSGPTGNDGCPARVFGVFPPTLQDVYDYIKKNNIQLVVVLDIQSLPIAAAAWQVVANSVDGQGRPSYASTMFKIPALLFNTSPTSGIGDPANEFIPTFPDVVNTTLGQTAHYTNVSFNPVFHSSGIAPVPAAADIDDVDSTAVDAGNPTFGSEQAMINWLNTFRTFNLFGPINIAAVEVSMKEEPGTPNGGILSSVLPVAQMLDASKNPTVTTP